MIRARFRLLQVHNESIDSRSSQYMRFAHWLAVNRLARSNDYPLTSHVSKRERTGPIGQYATALQISAPGSPSNHARPNTGCLIALLAERERRSKA